MFVARDTEGTLIWANEANKQTDYFCPVCSGKLILRAGEVNAHHFAHEAGACPDHWHYDMSDWHKTMQEQFPIECREVVMKHNGEIHRADVFKDGVVVEFQHSPITPQEFRERNTFYNTLGYKVAWVFDVSDKGIVPTIGKDGLPDYFHLYWERPLSVLRFGPVPQQDSINAWVSICFYFGTIETGEDKPEYAIRRVNWSHVDHMSWKPTYKYFDVDDDHEIHMSGKMDMLDFFPYHYRDNAETACKGAATAVPARSGQA